MCVHFIVVGLDEHDEKTYKQIEFDRILNSI